MRYGLHQAMDGGQVRYGGGIPCLPVLAARVSMAGMRVHGIVSERVIG